MPPSALLGTPLNLYGLLYAMAPRGVHLCRYTSITLLRPTMYVEIGHTTLRYRLRIFLTEPHIHIIRNNYITE